MKNKKRSKNIKTFNIKTKFGTFKVTTKIVKLLSVLALIILLLIVIIVNKSTDFLTEGILGSKGENKTEEELQAELQQLTDESMFRIKVNERPSMDVETGTTSIIVQNSIENPFNKKVRYYTSDGIEIYETRELYPGDDELSAVFELDWDKGEYQILADIIAIDKELGEEFIVSTMDIILRIK